MFALLHLVIVSIENTAERKHLQSFNVKLLVKNMKTLIVLLVTQIISIQSIFPVNDQKTRVSQVVMETRFLESFLL